MTRVFVFTDHKGGVGKSTSATNTALGRVAFLRGGSPTPRVLLIDTDSQGHATLVTTRRKDFGADDSLYTVLMADRTNAAATLVRCIPSVACGSRPRHGMRVCIFCPPRRCWKGPRSISFCPASTRCSLKP